MPIPFETLGGTGSKSSRGSPKMALVDNRYKLLTDMECAGDKDLLFDLLADRGETKNLAAEHADIVQSMKAKLAAFRASCQRSAAGKDYTTPFTPDQADVNPNTPGATGKSGKRATMQNPKAKSQREASRHPIQSFQ